MVLGREALSLRVKRALQKALLEEGWLQLFRAWKTTAIVQGSTWWLNTAMPVRGRINASVSSGG